jgi:hypothetical protein
MAHPTAHSMHHYNSTEDGAARPRQGFAMPANIGVRRAQPAAAIAYTCAQILRAPKEYHDRLYGCHICGELAPPEWCNTCEVNKTPYSARWPNLRAPYCSPCMALDLPCRICSTVPSTGPSDMDMAPPGWYPGYDGPPIAQVAGYI